MKTLPVSTPLVICLLLAFAACSRSGDAASAGSSEVVARCPLRGSIIAIDPEGNRLHLRYDEIPGVLPGGVQDFRVSPETIAAARLGNRITAELVRRPDGYWVENVEYLKR
ncbi:MAG: copper-binding protein [Opitutaceae bacterium]